MYEVIGEGKKVWLKSGVRGIRDEARMWVKASLKGLTYYAGKFVLDPPQETGRNSQQSGLFVAILF